MGFTQLATLQLGLGDCCQILQQLKLFRGERSWLAVDDTERTHTITVDAMQGVPCVETNIRIAGHQWIVKKPLVFGSVVNDKGLIIVNSVSAK